MAFPSPRPPWAEQCNRLRVFAQREPRSAELAEPLAAIGLLFGVAAPYPQTPALAEPLLRSGVDGVHWSALPADSDSAYVVVMTVPSAQRPNRVVGTSVMEFLGLGCVSGYATLDPLATDPASALPAADELDEPALLVLAPLRSALDLHAWADIPGRLRFLKQRFGRPAARATLPGTPPPEWAELHERIWQRAQSESWRFD